ncbi:hypothetical protein GCM10020219_000450 [Nonomuraea dietziae]
MNILRVGDSAWAAVTQSSAFVFGLEAAGEDSRVMQWYWGPRLPDEALAEVVRQAPRRIHSGFHDPRDVDELLPVEGGARWGVPSLQVTYEGGVRSVELTFAEAVVADSEIELVLRDPLGLRVGLHVRVASEVVERWVSLTNEGEHAVRLGRVDSGSWVIPERAGYRYTGVAGAWAQETQLHRAELAVGETTFTSRTGTTSHRANPWIMIDAGDATEELGEVWSVALAWSGSWRLTAQRRPEGDVAVTAGFGHDGPTWHLARGRACSPRPSSACAPAAGTARPAGALARLRPPPRAPHAVRGAARPLQLVGGDLVRRPRGGPDRARPPRRRPGRGAVRGG